MKEIVTELALRDDVKVLSVQDSSVDRHQKIVNLIKKIESH